MAQPGALDVGSVLSRTFNIWLKNFVPFAVLGLLVMSPVVLFALFFPITKGTIWLYSSVVGFGPAALSVVVASAVAYGVFQQMRGQTVALGQCVSVGISRLLPVLAVSIVVGLMILFGFLLLFVPGIILMCIFYVAVPAAVVEKAGVQTALNRSATLTKGARVSVFVVALVLGLVAWAAGFAVDLLIPDPAAPVNITSMSEALEKIYSGMRMQMVVSLLVGAVLGTLGAVGQVVVYHDLRVQKEQVDLEKITSVFN